MAEELSEQPAYPNYVGASLVVAAGRRAFASEALGGLLKRLGAVPFEHHEPDPTCDKADELASWRRAAADSHVPKAPLPWEGEPEEYVPKAQVQMATMLPRAGIPIRTGVRAARTAFDPAESDEKPFPPLPPLPPVACGCM